MTDQFPGYQGVASSLVSKEELDAVSRLSGDIISSLDKIALLREQGPDAAKAEARNQSLSSSSSLSSGEQRPMAKRVCRRVPLLVQLELTTASISKYKHLHLHLHPSQGPPAAAAGP